MDQYEQHQHLLNGIHETYIAKNKDYGNSATETFKVFGLVSYATRIFDKMQRLITYVHGESDEMHVKDESIRDTLLDMAKGR